MTATLSISDDERRVRLVTRHRLARTAADTVEAVRAVVAMHSSDPATPHLGLWARVAGYSTAQLDDALCGARSLWRLHAMRRTLFVVPADEAAIFQAGAADEVARKERQKLLGWLSAEMNPAEVPAWLFDVEEKTLAAMAASEDHRTQDLSAAVPELKTELTLGTGKWSARSPLNSRLLFLMAMEGRIVRTRPAGTWRSSQYRWSATSTWFDRGDRGVEPFDADTGRTELLRRYLAVHGPATATDMRWWTGWTARATTSALRSLDAVPVVLEGGEDRQGWVLPDDTGAQDPPAQGQQRVALLPSLDPTPMGWKQRDWYLGRHGDELFDRNGNVGPTVWVDGRVVGGWGQRPDGAVVVRLLEDVDADAADSVDSEAAALTAWLDGTVVAPRFRTPLEKQLSDP